MAAIVISTATQAQSNEVPSTFAVTDNGVDGYDVSGFIPYPQQQTPVPTATPQPTAQPTPTPTPEPTAIPPVVSTTQEVVQAIDYGIVADGITDNYQAILAVICQNRPVHWPSGTIVFNTPINFNAISDNGCPVNDIIWQGNGPGSTVLKYTGPGTGITIGRLNPFNGPGLQLRDLAIVGNGTLGHTSQLIGGYTTINHAGVGTTSIQTCLSLHSLTVPGPKLENIRIQHCNVGLLTQNTYNLDLSNSVVHHNNVGVKLSHTTTASNIRRTEIGGNAVGVWITDSGIQNIIIEDNVFEANWAGTGILTNGGDYLHIGRNYFSANKDNFVHIGYNPADASTYAFGILNGAFFEENFGLTADFGDSVRLAKLWHNGLDTTLSYVINDTSTDGLGLNRRIILEDNYIAFGATPYESYP